MKSISEIYTCLEACQYHLTTDSRKPIPGGIFLALKGERFNGNAYAAAALEAGAAYVVVDEAAGVPRDSDPRYLLVHDGLETLQQLAAFHRARFSIPVIAVCGSNGKTTTKELIVAVLRNKGNVLYTEGNLNNHIGVPLTLLRLRPEHNLAVIEMGANHLQEIADLCEIAQPTHGLITSIGKDHLEGYGSVENVARSNEELFDYLRKTQGFAWINADDAYVNTMRTEGLNCAYYGKFQPFSGKITEQKLTGMQIQLLSPAHSGGVALHTHLAGRHNLQNLTAAWAVGHTFGVDAPRMAEALSEYQPRNNRSQILEKNGKTILLDAYNANPSSVEAGLDFFFSVPGQHKAVILGDMFELGDYAEAEHLRILEKAIQQEGVKVIACGSHFFHAAGVIAYKNLRTWPDTDRLLQAADEVRAFLQDCDQIMIKGSRGMAMERVTDLIGG